MPPRRHDPSRGRPGAYVAALCDHADRLAPGERGGQTVGDSKTECGNDAVLWSPSGKGTALRDVDGEGTSLVYAINDAGWSAGW
jgi:hypothetical protein